VSGPLIPYVVVPELPLSFLRYVPLLGDKIDPANPLTLKPFGALVATGVAIGWWLSIHRGGQRGLDTKKQDRFMQWSVGTGFVMAHVLDALAYHPEMVAADPWYLLRLWEGLSSYGGIIGGIIGAWAWSRVRKENVLEFLDVCISAFSFAWIFGRAGCSVVHDHPGALSNAWFAVKYPAHTLQAGFAGRLDLGLMEMVLTIPLALACFVLWRRQPLRPAGFYISLTLVVYAPIRFLLDFLRVQPGDPLFHEAADPRYLSLTPAQWVCFGALAMGLYYGKKVWGADYVALAPLAPPDQAPAKAGGDATPADGDATPTDGEAAPADGEAAPTVGQAAPVDGEAEPE
jgi:phosphatidylglycerol:prolipoprotein diacylglycerol transferase